MTFKDTLDIYSSGSLLAGQIFCLFTNILGAIGTVALINFLKADTNSACDFVTTTHYCTLEREFKLMPLTIITCGFAVLLMERTVATIFYKTYEQKTFKLTSIGLAAIPWVISLGTMAVSLSRIFQTNPEPISFCGVQALESLQYFIFIRISFPVSAVCIGGSCLILLVNYLKKKNTIVEIASQSRLSARYQLDENLQMTKKIVISSTMVVSCFGLNILLLESIKWWNYWRDVRIFIEEFPGTMFGIYATAFVIVITYDIKQFRKTYIDFFHCLIDRFTDKNRDEEYHCNVVNGTNLSDEGKEYFEYYRKLWQAEKPTGWRAIRFKYFGF
ncbi:hypothetical protein FO519_008590 [Halicephalobus sp. NKZ332]|nr:hypothetical protein FO519_008590 [Halicephalobus sp. NKZ332]